MDRITDPQHWPEAPRLLEDVYSVLDAVVVGDLLVSLVKHADRVGAASLAQLVNVIAPIMTEPGGPAWRQTTFHPFATTARLARGTSLRTLVTSERVATSRHGDVDVLSAAASWDSGSGEGALFLVNRDQHQPLTVTVDASGFGRLDLLEAVTLADDDLHAVNDREHPDRVTPVRNTSATASSGLLTVELPPVSWTAVSFTAAP